MVSIKEKLRDLGLQLPEPFPSMGSYVPAILAGDLLFVAGHPPAEEGRIKFRGKFEKDLTIEEGQEAARLCLMNCLAAAAAALDDLDRVRRAVKVTGYVNSMPDFDQQPAVINGASDLLQEIFGEDGKHARAAVGVNALPANIAVELEIILQVLK